MGRAEDIFQRLEIQGETYIDELIETRKSEESFLDFKRSSNNGTTSKIDIGDRNNLAKALSGFANSEGGVVIWGVDCSRLPDLGDVAVAKVLIENPQRFVSLIEGVISGCTVPAIQDCRSIHITSQNDKGFVATLIPRSNQAPHQIIQDKRYLIRSGSNFEPVPHAVLAGMFGRHPQPVVFPNFQISPLVIVNNVVCVEAVVMLVNNGSVVAEDCFASVLTTKIGGGKNNLGFEPNHMNGFQHTSALGVDFSVMAKREFRLPPGGFVNIFSLNFQLWEKPSTDLNIKLTAGCSGAPPYQQSLIVNRQELENLYLSTHQKWESYQARQEVNWSEISAKMLGLAAHLEIKK